jgi:hypothetical protein
MTGGGKPVAGASTAVSGGLMSMNVKLVAGIAALVAIAGILTWSAIERNRIGVVDDVVASRRLDARLDVRSLPESSASSVDERARVALTPDEIASAIFTASFSRRTDLRCRAHTSRSSVRSTR